MEKFKPIRRNPDIENQGKMIVVIFLVLLFLMPFLLFVHNEYRAGMKIHTKNAEGISILNYEVKELKRHKELSKIKVIKISGTTHKNRLKEQLSEWIKTDEVEWM